MGRYRAGTDPDRPRIAHEAMATPSECQETQAERPLKRHLRQGSHASEP